MVIHNFHVVGISVVPAKTNAPLVVDSDAVLASAIAFQRFEPISRRRQQLSNFCGCMKNEQLSTRDTLDVLRKSPGNWAANIRSVSEQAKLRITSNY